MGLGGIHPKSGHGRTGRRASPPYLREADSLITLRTAGWYTALIQPRSRSSVSNGMSSSRAYGLTAPVLKVVSRHCSCASIVPVRRPRCVRSKRRTRCSVISWTTRSGGRTARGTETRLTAVLTRLLLCASNVITAAAWSLLDALALHNPRSCATCVSSGRVCAQADLVVSMPWRGARSSIALGFLALQRLGLLVMIAMFSVRAGTLPKSRQIPWSRRHKSHQCRMRRRCGA